MDERQSARAEIDDSRERMKNIAAQLARRAEPNYVKQKAKEVAVEKSMELKDRIIGSPVALGIIGGLATAVVARAVLGQQQSRGTYARGPMGYESDELGEKAREAKTLVSEKVEAVKEQAGQLKEKAMQQVEALRERIPPAEEVKDKAQQVVARARDYASEEPLITALGALAIGAAFGFLLPLTQRERRLLAPAREQVGAKLESLGNQVTEKVQSKVDDLREKISGEEGESASENGSRGDGDAERDRASSEAPYPNPPAPPPLH
jgi:ElaB/YqjD/DUF883 family membrane-anchored ribosome-binding protein